MMKKNTLIYIVAILAIFAVVYSFFAFDKAFPIVNVKISADKGEVLRQADSLSSEFGLMKEGYRSVAAFDTDNRFKNYVELEGGGVEVFQAIIDEQSYDPYYWMVRQFNDNQIKECIYAFTPDGVFLGFKLTLPDSLPGADIEDPDIAGILDGTDPRSSLIPDLSDYTLIEESSEVKEGGRRDHILTYEKTDAGVGEALYRFKIRISGDEVTMAMPTVKIPESFDQRYEEMRSANTTISTVGQAIMLLLYGIVGVGLAIFFMIRKRSLNWKPVLKWGVLIGSMIALAYMTTISLSWFNYDTSLSSGQFLFQNIFVAILNGLLIAAIFFVSVLAAEGLDRQAFPEHIQLWRSWSPTAGASKEVMRHTVFGYLWALFMIGFITFFYWISNHVFGWWSPAENMVDPNVLALPLPWLLPAAQSLQAGFWEETLFRAVPLAGAVLIGKNFKRKGLWIGLALVLQAAIFGSMHANYAQQPAYARIIEMIIPFVIYGLIYMNWGLLPVIISHFVYDIILMALPLFLLSAPGIWIHRLLAIVVMLVPLGVVVYRRVKAGSWVELKDEDLNKGFVIPEEVKKEKIQKPETPSRSDHRDLPVIVAVILLITGAALWLFLTPGKQDVPKLSIDRDKAVEIANAFVEAQYPMTDSLNYKPYVRMVGGVGRSGRFVWEHGGSENGLFRSLYGNELEANYFVVTYKTFEGDVVTRSETIDVHVARDGVITEWFHNVPEPYPGVKLEEDEAKALAANAITEHYDKDISELELVKVVPEQRKARTDWTIIYKDDATGLTEGDIRYVASLSGGDICGLKRTVHTTEAWDRTQKKEGVIKTILLVVSKVIQFGMLITVLIFGIIAWTRKQFNVRLFLYFALGFGLISVLQSLLLTNSIIGQYPTSEPYANLMLMLAIGILLGTVFSSFLYAVPIGYMARIPLHVKRTESVIGLKGVGLGLIFAAVVSFASGDVFGRMPVVVTPVDLESFSPLLSTFLMTIENYFVTFIMLMVPFVIAERLSEFWQKRKVITLALLFLAGFAYVGKLSVGLWFLGGSVVGLLMIALYIWVLRYNMIYIPVMTVTLLILEQIQYVRAAPAVNTGAHVGITIVVSLLLAVFSVWGMYRLRILQPKDRLSK